MDKEFHMFPDSVTWDDIEERIHFLSAIDKGLDDIKSGKTIPHEEVKESLKNGFQNNLDNFLLSHVIPAKAGIYIRYRKSGFPPSRE